LLYNVYLSRYNAAAIESEAAEAKALADAKSA
jgi:hypothetical protein